MNLCGDKNMCKKIILLNGPSSSGKTTLASQLQKCLKDMRNKAYDIISIDDFLEMTTEEPIYEDDVFEISSKLCEKAIEMLGFKQGIIIDHVITSERIFYQLMETLKDYRIYLVYVTCPLAELERREKERRNRCLGSAEASNQYLFPKDGYDLTVDTFHLSVEECSLHIMDGLNRR